MATVGWFIIVQVIDTAMLEMDSHYKEFTVIPTKTMIMMMGQSFPTVLAAGGSFAAREAIMCDPRSQISIYLLN